jgi:cytidylate kinase
VADDGIVIDSSGLSIDEVFNLMMSKITAETQSNVHGNH